MQTKFLHIFTNIKNVFGESTGRELPATTFSKNLHFIHNSINLKNVYLFLDFKIKKLDSISVKRRIKTARLYGKRRADHT